MINKNGLAWEWFCEQSVEEQTRIALMHGSDIQVWFREEGWTRQKVWEERNRRSANRLYNMLYFGVCSDRVLRTRAEVESAERFPYPIAV